MHLHGRDKHEEPETKDIKYETADFLMMGIILGLVVLIALLGT